jgi:hypothetical protein
MPKFLHSGQFDHQPRYRYDLMAAFCVIFLFVMPLLFFNAAYSQATGPAEKSGSDYSDTELRRGERLFRGLTPFESGMHDCASCHYVAPTETINWNPSTYDLAEVWLHDENYQLTRVMNNPGSARLKEDHKGMTITDKEARMLEAYFVKVTSKGSGQLHETPENTALFWLFGLLMALAVVDLLFTKIVRFKFIHVIVILAGLVVHTHYAVAGAIDLGRTENYAPDQPIKFSHKIHAGENKIDCRYCHHIVDESKSAGIPSTNVCLNCHLVVRNGTRSGTFEINKIHRAQQAGMPIEWIRVHRLPDHSFFSHSQHVNAGKLDCTECHGVVEEMDIVKQVEPLSMGWCLDCHRTRKVDFIDNPYYQIYDELHQQIKEGIIDSVTVARVGGQDCMKCHY